MSEGAIPQLEDAVDALCDEALPWLLADFLVQLHRLRSRLDAQISRRVRAFDRSKEWAVAGARTPGAWLQRECRMSGRDAAAEVSSAREVEPMSAVADAWASGAISTAHVEVLASTRRSAKSPERFAEFEDVLVQVAETGSAKDVANVAAQWRDAVDAERQSVGTLVAHLYESRHLDIAETLDRRVYLNGFADGEAGSVISRAVDNEVEAQRQANDERTPGQLRIDALAAICERDLDRLPVGANRPHVGVIGDVGTFAGAHVGLSETDTGVRLAPDTLRRIACDAFVYTAAVDANSAVLDLGRAVRTFTPTQRRATRSSTRRACSPDARSRRRTAGCTTSTGTTTARPMSAMASRCADITITCPTNSAGTSNATQRPASSPGTGPTAPTPAKHLRAPSRRRLVSRLAT
jgi:hypothetical protein